MGSSQRQPAMAAYGWSAPRGSSGRASCAVQHPSTCARPACSCGRQAAVPSLSTSGAPCGAAVGTFLKAFSGPRPPAAPLHSKARGNSGADYACTPAATCSEAVAKCKAEINSILMDEESKEELDCPAGIVGRIIGRGGETIRALQSASQVGAPPIWAQACLSTNSFACAVPARALGLQAQPARQGWQRCTRPALVSWTACSADGLLLATALPAGAHHCGSELPGGGAPQDHRAGGRLRGSGGERGGERLPRPVVAQDCGRRQAGRQRGQPQGS